MNTRICLFLFVPCDKRIACFKDTLGNPSFFTAEWKALFKIATYRVLRSCWVAFLTNILLIRKSKMVIKHSPKRSAVFGKAYRMVDISFIDSREGHFQHISTPSFLSRYLDSLNPHSKVFGSSVMHRAILTTTSVLLTHKPERAVKCMWT